MSKQSNLRVYHIEHTDNVQKNRMVNSGDFRQDPNYVAPDKEKEKLILQLGTMITDRYLVKYSRTMKTDDPEYWALDEVLTKEEAKFLLSFKKTRVPYDIEDLAKMTRTQKRWWTILSG